MAILAIVEIRAVLACGTLADKMSTLPDLLIEQDNRLYPIEIKKTATPSRTASRNFDVLSRLGRDIGPGAVLCLKETVVPLSAEVSSIPIWCL